MASQIKILVIDDDVDFRESVKAILEAEGYIVLEAASGREGLEQLVEHRPHLIILDVMMETLEEGYGVNQAIKFQDAYADYRQVPIVMVSSIMETPFERYPRAEEVEMIRPDVYVTKPLDVPRFLEIVKKAVEKTKPS
ncbi:MAG: response regulator [Gemmatimonadota bacterium]|nr:MAG: response regulator [Gemmatimonadota bacterium]